VAEARLAEGRVFLFEPLITKRAQTHAMFKLLFGGIHFGNSTRVRLADVTTTSAGARIGNQ
jgi:hypothetical protein